MNRIEQWLKYYRASLIDGATKPKNNIFESPVKRERTYSENLDPSEIEGLQKLCDHKLFVIKDKDEETEIEWAAIQIAPVFIINEFEHTKNQDGEFSIRHYPFWISARINKKGVLSPPAEDEFPVFMRTYLSPNPQNLPSIAEINKLDEVLSRNPTTISQDNWNKYWESCEELFKSVTGNDFQSYHKGPVRFAFCIYGDIKTTRNIRNLYDQLLKETSPGNELMQALLTEGEEPLNKELTPENSKNVRHAIFLNKNHYGQMRCDFPLSRSQRVAFAEFLEDAENKVFAVNGPPGTGKTTLLQSIIANNVVTPLLNESEPMLMVGCSTNNQAITNILDSMESADSNGNDILSKRWLPDVSGFGLYFTSSQRNPQNSQNYQQATNNFLNDGFVGNIDQKKRISEFENYYVKEAAQLFDFDKTPTFAEIKKIIKEHIETTKQKIDTVLNSVIAYENIPEILEAHGFENEESLLNRIEELRNAINAGQQFGYVLTRIADDLSDCYKKLPFFIKYLPFGHCKRYKSNKFQLILHPIIGRLSPNLPLHKYHHIIAEIDRLKLETIENTEISTRTLKDNIALENEISRRKENYQTVSNEWAKEYRERWDSVIAKAPEYGNLPIDETTAAKLDISYRYNLFWLCVHYREAQYIELLNLKDNNGFERKKNAYKKKLQRLAHITPLFISTFHSLPRFSNYYDRGNGDSYFRDLYDLMIVDEAGQVSPEVAVASFALTKRILAVGDVKQIEPVSGITDHIDFFNAQKYGLLSSNEEYNNLAELGFMASECNLMQLVKKSCPYKFTFNNGETDKGPYLLEHYRCLNEIIRYSNRYVYNNSLDLRGGESCGKNHSLPPMGYIHVNGTDEPINGSRRNDLEARVIAEWISEEYKNLEAAYQKDIWEILAVVAPFAAQISLIKRYLKESIGKEICDKITIGTVHALQGAGREIILFSSVYGNYSNRMFFDLKNKYNMLNVATTRAKHSFIVFGNMRIFQPNLDTPSGNLAKILFSKEEYNLSQNFIYSSERIYKSNNAYKVTRLTTLEEHRNYLKSCFKEAQNTLLIFSPFISSYAINADKITDLIKEAVRHNVKVIVITDEYFDRQNGELKKSAKEGREKLTEAGAELVTYKGVHNKTICVDEQSLAEGSFNWLSAVRNENSIYHKKNSSVILQGDGIKKMITTVKKDFDLEKIIKNG